MAVVGSSAGAWQGLQPQPCPVVVWTAEEKEILQEGLIKYCEDSGFDLYARIAADLQGKSIRDVAMRCKWMTRRARYPSISPYALVPMQDNDVNAIDAHIGSLLDTNKQLFRRVQANLSKSNPMENIPLLSDAFNNILKIKTIYEESLRTNNMPPLPVTLESDLANLFNRMGMTSSQYPIPPY